MTRAVPFGGFSSFASGANEAGSVVGYVDFDGGITTRAIVWDAAGFATDLTSRLKGSKTSIAQAINKKGAIVGATNRIGRSRADFHAFLIERVVEN